MLRLVIASLAASLMLSACDDGEWIRRGQEPPASCSSFTNCQSCTPVLGCGWCMYSNGKGSCTSGPAFCNAQPAYSWTWELAWCPAVLPPVDAGFGDAFSPSNDTASDTSAAADTATAADTQAGD